MDNRKMSQGTLDAYVMSVFLLLPPRSHGVSREQAQQVYSVIYVYYNICRVTGHWPYNNNKNKELTSRLNSDVTVTLHLYLYIVYIEPKTMR